jgi:hypothetical protein
MKRATLIVILGLLWLTPQVFGQNCCMPKLEDEDSTSARLAEGLQAATVVLLTVPALLVGGLILWIRRARRDSPDTTIS